MKKYNIQNYIRYKEDLKRSMPEGKFWDEYTRNELIIKFMPLVESLARKFPSSQQASGVLSINDLIQCGNEGLIKAVDKLDWNLLNESEDMEKTLKSFFSKRIKGRIRRQIDINRGDMRIPEYKINEIRKNFGKDKAIVQLFFNQIFVSLDEELRADGYGSDESEASSYAEMIEDKAEPYNIALMNVYLLGIMKKHLNEKQYDVLRLSYGLDCEKHSAKEIASKLDITGVSNYVRISEIKKSAIDKLIDEVPAENVIDYL
jgi:RNA polymerase sigma factor (sigma-70 family)|tara:strand:- start:311 stop:1090 length:780 start_codon:yes stop_codon:yes gene_type:complete